MVETTRQTDYKRKRLDINRDGNLLQRGSKILRNKDLHSYVEQNDGLGEIARAYEQTELAYTEMNDSILQSEPQGAEELQTAMAEFAKYKTLNKIKDDVRRQIDKLEADKRSYYAKYEMERKKLWRAYYKAKEEAEGKEKDLEKIKGATYDPDYERKMKLEFGCSMAED